MPSADPLVKGVSLGITGMTGKLSIEDYDQRDFKDVCQSKGSSIAKFTIKTIQSSRSKIVGHVLELVVIRDRIDDDGRK